MFDLEQAITAWRQQMLSGGIRSRTTLEELEGHLRAEIERQIHSGMNEQTAMEIAVQQLGCPGLVGIEFKKSHPINSLSLAAFRRYMIVINLILAVVLTTPNIKDQALMFIPLQLSYEAIIWIVRLSEHVAKRRIKN